MSAPAPQTVNTANGSSSSQQQQNNNKQRNGRSSTPQDNRGGYTEGDSNGYNGKPKGNPAFKKNWQQKSGTPEPVANGQEDQKRKGKERVNDQEVVDSNAPNANGDKPQREKKPRDRRGAKDSNTNQAPPPAEQQPQQPQPQPQPQQQPQQVVQPHVDRQRVEESKRLTTLIATQQAELTPDQRKTINKVKAVVPNVAEADIRATLEQHNWDYLRTVDLYTENPNASSWSAVVGRKPKKETPPQAEPEKTERPRDRGARELRERNPDRERTPRGPREDRAYQKANGELNQRYQQKPQQPQQPQQPGQPQQGQHPQHPQAQHPQAQHPQAQNPPQHPQAQHPPANAQPQHPQAQHPQAQHPQAQHPQAQHHAQVQQQVQHQLHQQHLHQLQQQQYQQHLYQQQQYQQQLQQQQQQQQQPEVFSPADGEQLIMGFSKAIEVQLAEIAERSRLLIQMQTELANIHAANKDQLTSLHEEKGQLLEDKARLQAQLQQIDERLTVIDVSIDKAEQDKITRLKDWQRKSATLGQQLLTNH